MDKPDIIFIVLDTQRADRLGAYGYSNALTPNLDRFADNSVLFEQAISPAQWTIPSHASMFSGLYPTAHRVTQSTHRLPGDVPHLAEVLRDGGYQTVGFCNNPLVGILNNGLKRGFDAFYNYGGAVPSVPKTGTRVPWPFRWLTEQYTQLLRRISYPIQNFFGQSDLAFRISLNAWLTPLWSRFANFKGQNPRSARDVTNFLRDREKRPSSRPLFLFLNLMETHLPFWPPGEFVDRVAPYFRHSKEARRIMRTWNREAYRWAAPLRRPLGELESRVLNDMYDAEVAYQDDYLGPLFQLLARRANHDNTLTVIVADHGDGLGEHGYFGHAFVAYQELVHVPLMVQWPRRLNPTRITSPVSTRRVFHTLLDAAGKLPEQTRLDPVNVHRLSLVQTIYGSDPEQQTAFSEVYPPLNFVRAIEHRQADLLEAFRCLSTRRAVVQANGAGPKKLIHVDDEPDELFDLDHDPGEMDNLLGKRPSHTDHLHQTLRRMAQRVKRQRGNRTAEKSAGDMDDTLRQRLRGLGYLD